MISLTEAKNLRWRTVLYHSSLKNSDGTPQRWRVNGKPKTWKRDPSRVRVPLKRGLYEYGYLTERDLMDFFLVEKPSMIAASLLADMENESDMG